MLNADVGKISIRRLSELSSFLLFALKSITYGDNWWELC